MPAHPIDEHDPDPAHVTDPVGYPEHVGRFWDGLRN
jgi:hypothetical protein